MGKDDIALIVGDLFQRDLVREPSRILARVSEAISELHIAGLLWRYDAAGTALLYISFWDSTQRVDKPLKGRFPRPDGTMNYKDSVIREHDGNIREDSREVLPGTGEQGNRGTGTSSSSATQTKATEEAKPPAKKRVKKPGDDDPQWLEFWSLVPRKQGKTEARGAWRNAINGTGEYEGEPIPKTDPAVIIEGIRRYAVRMRSNRTEYKSIKMPQGWINGRRWEDEDDQPAPPVQVDIWATAPAQRSDLWGSEAA
ncbi:hypothetical protein AB0I28_12405 [Phytomonospora sp. NPDC050363]|uniref:hypothetical protein n=1 Tax=Phytomonospora sp. NPDC050363 TaxID=3155642 RepID=UPI0033D0A378